MRKSQSPSAFDSPRAVRSGAAAQLDHWRRSQLVLQAAGLYDGGDWREAERLCRSALEGGAHHVGALNLLGMIAMQTERAAEAVALLKRAAAVAPTDAMTHNVHGTALYAAKRYADAVRSYDRALRLQPHFAMAHSNRGVALLELNRPAAALESLERALDCQPELAEAFNNRGNALRELRRLEEACASFDRAIALRSDYAEAHVNRASTRLLSGDYATGWPEYEWRWKKGGITTINERRNLTQPLWLGTESLAGKTILLHCEQGLGDTLQFCRYVSLIAARGARVILEAPESLRTLLATLPGVSQLITPDTPLPPLDYHCPLFSLPLAFNTTLESIPSPGRYLASDAGRVEQWRARLAESRRARIGLVWRGNALHGRDAQRSIPPAQFMRYLTGEFQYISLQKDLREADRDVLRAHPSILDVSAELEDFADTAALCDCLDLIIAADTSVAHLSAALGRPTWILLPSDPDFRWLLDREDSPWYPTVKLYRQASVGEWNGVLERVGADLQQRFAPERDAPLT